MEDEYGNLIQDDEAPTPAATEAQAIPESPELKKLQKENHSLRVRLRRSEMETKYGADVLELVDDDLPLEKQEALAERLADKFRSTKEPETETPAPEPTPEVISEDDQKLAAVGTGPSSGTSATAGLDLSAKEIGERFAGDPEAFRRAIAAKYGNS